MLTHKPWWDTIDMIAIHMVGKYMKCFPDQIPVFIYPWSKEDNLWLARTSILFQLRYKEKTNTEILAHCIRANLHYREFFMQKAIGWALRQYGSTQPDWVVEFVEQNPLSPLSKREALRKIKKGF